MPETFYEVMRRQGITRRSFLKYCSLAAGALGLSPAFAPKIAHAMETKPRIPVLWLHGLECTCCSESFIRSAHPLVKDVILSMISLDYGWGCVQAARPNPTRATPTHKIPGIGDKPIIKVPGCPPISEVMTAVITYMLTFEKLPELDNQGRPKMFYSQRIHDKCYRRPHFDAGQFVEKFDDEGARKGYCLYKVGCKGPTTYNACSTVRWNGGLSFPIQAGHPCIGCSEDGFWDKGGFYDRLTDVHGFGIEANADEIGKTAAGIVAGAAAIHAGASVIKRIASKGDDA